MDTLAQNPLHTAKRVAIKIGSALLVDREKRALRREWLESLGADVATLRARGVDVVIISSGSIALGREILNLPDQLTLEQSQAAAAVGQIALAQAYQDVMSARNIYTGQVLVTLEDSQNRRRYLNTQATLRTLLGYNIVPIVNENDTVATDEIRFGDNDRLAAQVAVMAGADTLILLSDIDGLYTDNPRRNIDAVHIPFVERITSEIEAMASGPGTAGAKGGMVTKIAAAKTATLGGVNMAIAKGEVMHPITTLAEGGRATWFQAMATAAQARKMWISAMKMRGELHIDDGAVAALFNGKSLLSVGLTHVSGEFDRGDPVNIVSADGETLARGLVNYDSPEAAKLTRAKSTEIEGRLGYPGRGVLVHRDNMVQLETRIDA